MKKIFLIIILFTLKFFSQENKIAVIENDTINCSEINYFLDFEDIEFKNFSLKSSEFKSKKARIYYYQYFNNIEVTRGELLSDTNINKSNVKNNDSIYNVRLFIKSLENNRIRVNLFTDYKNSKAKSESITFEKLEKTPNEIDFQFDGSEKVVIKPKLVFNIVVGYLAGQTRAHSEFMYSNVSNKRFQANNHSFDMDYNYFVFEYVFE